MSLKDTLEAALHQAMKDHDNSKKNAIRMLMTNIKLAEIEKGSALDDSMVISAIQKEIKQHRETILEAEKGARKDIIQEAEKEISLLQTFLPPQLSEPELRQLVQESIQESNAITSNDIGKVMKVLMPKISGRAPGEYVNKIVREYLNK